MADRHLQDRRPTSPIQAGRAGLICLALCAIAIAIDGIFVMGPSQSLTREGGAIELASAGLYFVAVAVLVTRRQVGMKWPASILLVAMGLRELDADKRFTSEGILSTKIFVYDTSLWEKTLAALVLAVLVWAIATMLVRTVPTLLCAIRNYRSWSLYLCAAGLLVVVSKSIDGLGRKLAPYGVTLSETVNSVSGQIEEVLELGIPILVIMAIIGLGAPQRAQGHS